MLATESAGLIPLGVSDIRQHVYCPRIPYFRLTLRLRPTTASMEEGKAQHERIEDLEHRRSLRAYGLSDGERTFNVNLHSPRLQLSGRIDMLIRTPSAELIPVEFKNSDGPVGLNQKYQLTGYALLLEERYRTPVRRAFVYFIPTKQVQEVAITSATRRYTHRVLDSIRASVLGESTPEGTRRLGRCSACEYLTFCNDRW